MSGRLARAGKISAILLMAGLAVEFIEAAKYDKELAETMERTAIAEKEAGRRQENAGLPPTIFSKVAASARSCPRQRLPGQLWAVVLEKFYARDQLNDESRP
jgi:hypothetical protein